MLILIAYHIYVNIFAITEFKNDVLFLEYYQIA
jgi:hypothetical protein